MTFELWEIWFFLALFALALFAAVFEHLRADRLSDECDDLTVRLECKTQAAEVMQLARDEWKRRHDAKAQIVSASVQKAHVSLGENFIESSRN